MMKIGNRGFMLAEVVVVSVVIATVLVTLFAGLNNVSSSYETRNKYYDVDSLYVAMEINDILVREEKINTISKSDITLLSGGDIDRFKAFYKNKVGYNINSYFIPYKSTSDNTYSLERGFNTLKNRTINSTFKEYIDYLSGNIDLDANFDYIIVVERENVSDKDDCYYYALKY